MGYNIGACTVFVAVTSMPFGQQVHLPPGNVHLGCGDPIRFELWGGPIISFLPLASSDARTSRARAGEEKENKLRSCVAAAPWQLRCHLLAATAAALDAVAMHSAAAVDALGAASFELLASHEEEETQGSTVLLAARERIFVATRDPSLRVQLAGAAALGPALRCSPLQRPPAFSRLHQFWPTELVRWHERSD